MTAHGMDLLADAKVGLRPVRLVLEDGSQWRGRLVVPAAGDAGCDVVGEVVFNTSMTGYQELLSDPSYAGQMVILTYPLVGNYGVRAGEDESNGPRVAALLAREIFDSSVVDRAPLARHLAEAGVPAAESFDTRALTRHLRRHGTLRGVLTTDLAVPVERLVERAVQWRPPLALDAGTPEPFCIDPGEEPWAEAAAVGQRILPSLVATGNAQGPAPHAVVMDFGAKRNILRTLVARGWRVTVVPGTTSADQVLALRPQAVIISNGPGDPRDLGAVLGTVRRVAEGVPTMGICLGHQLLGLAFGAKAYKLPFGHRGANHPVKELVRSGGEPGASEEGRVFITSQNHGYALDADSLEVAGLEVTHIHLNDHTVEGLRHPWLPVRGLQFHPEASPGPRDAASLMEEFLEDVLRGALRAPAAWPSGGEGGQASGADRSVALSKTNGLAADGTLRPAGGAADAAEGSSGQGGVRHA